MKYLLVCEHRKAIVDDSKPEGAVMQHKCQRCADDGCHNVRVYKATEKDIAIVGSGRTVETKHRYKVTNQLDFTKA